jgi:hypothetical protein
MHLIKVKDIWKYESYLMRQRKEGSKIMEFTFPIIAGLVVVLIFKLRYHHWETGDYFGLGINLRVSLKTKLLIKSSYLFVYQINMIDNNVYL